MNRGKRSSQLKGAIFEWFVRGILSSCGFRPVELDGKIVYNGPSGTMVHGMGQPHNTDVLMYPPLQTPFYFPSRLVIECKAYLSGCKKVGLHIVRSLLGLREDLNNFDIVTPVILRERRNYKRTSPSVHDYDRFLYSVALATLFPITMPGEEFALTHKIPVISFNRSNRYKFLRDLISNIDSDFTNSMNNFKDIISYFKEYDYTKNFNYKHRKLLKFVKQAKSIFDEMYIGVTENGEILFLHSPGSKYKPSGLEIKSTIHWESETSEWRIGVQDSKQEREFYFELPDYIYNAWADQKFDKLKAISVKEKYFKRISVFSLINKKLIFFILNLDMEFIKEAKRSLE